jgi:repressor LexA
MEINKYCANKLKQLRERKNITQQELADDLKINQQQIARYENNQRQFKQDFLFTLANYFKVSINEFFPPTKYDNAEPIINTVKIAIYGSIKAGIPLESQNDIIDYLEISKDIVKDRKIFGLKISGNSMIPKYEDGDIVLFEQTNDIETYKNKDCAVMINGTKSTFKKLIINENGIILQPYNMEYEMMIYSKEEVEKLPIVILGKAIKKVSDIN